MAEARATGRYCYLSALLRASVLAEGDSAPLGRLHDIGFSSTAAYPSATSIEEMAPDVQRTLITEQDPAKAADILEEMPPYEAADVLRDIHAGDAERIIGRMESEAARDIRELLAHDERTAEGMMTISCVEALPDQTAGSVLETLRPITEEVTEFNIVYVVGENDTFLGTVRLKDVLYELVPQLRE
jgi:Mg/Co/Ni transporter MgtE